MEQGEASHDEHDSLIEAMLECAPVVNKAMDLLMTAEENDQRLLHERIGQTPRHRYVIEWPAGSAQHPYSHRLVVLRPKSSFRSYKDIRDIQLRFATSEAESDADQSESAKTLNGKIVVTIDFSPDQQAHFLLTDHSWKFIGDLKHLNVQNGELTGINGHRGPTIQGVSVFADLLDDFEPIPHTNQE